MLWTTSRGSAAGQLGEDRGVLVGDAAAGIGVDQHEREIRARDRRPGALDAERFDGVVRRTKPGGVDDRQRNAADLDLRLHRVARRPGNRRDDRHRVPRELIEEARLADVGPADEDDGEPLAQQRTLLRPGQHPGHLGEDRRHPPAHVGRAQELDVLVREIERRFGVHPQFDQGIDQRADFARKGAGETARRGARRGGRRRGDEVGDAFGLREVELAVEKGPLRELPRPRQSRAELDAAPEQQSAAPSGPPCPCSSSTSSPV